MLLDNQEVAVEGTGSFIDEMLGGEEEHHSLAAEATTPSASETAVQDEGDQPIPDDDEEIFPSEDSNKEEQRKEIPDTSALRQEIDGLKKRLHDTQAAMHKATGDRAKLQKELDELKAKQEDEDDWFSEDDKERTEQLESDLKKSDEEIARCNSQEQEIAKKTAEAEWDEAAAPVIAQYPDFEKVVYDDFVGLLDASTGNAQVRAAWENLEDKSPASVYAFAKKTLDILEFQRDPEAYKENLRKQSTQVNYNPNAWNDASPIGKEGLDMLTSADVPIERTSDRVSFVDELFGQ